MDTFYNKLLEGNRKWVQKKLNEDPDFFTKLSLSQSPELLWIGCSDSRVPANEITGTQSGEVFVHRNIANMVVNTDINLLSVLEYAVNILKVKHVIVCGHYGCGGIEAAMSNRQLGVIDNWLRNIKDVYRLHQKELEQFGNMDERKHKLVELNIREQVLNLSKTSTVQNAWEKNQSLFLHGWVYDVGNGLIKDLNVTLREAKDVAAIYRFDE